MLTIFYDGNCPLCSSEMNHLKRYDNKNQITLINIHSQNFKFIYPSIDFVAAMKILHADYNGKLLLGLEVTHRAWTLVGKGFWVAPLNWPIFKTICHWCYLGFAKYRHQISFVLVKLLRINNQKKCTKGTCYDK